MAARQAVKQAQGAFDTASKKEQVGKEGLVTISDDEADNEAVDDVMEDPHNESVQRIHQGMDSIVTSLEELSTSADQLEQRVKRPRVSATHEKCFLYSCAAFWHGRCCMTSTYTHQGPYARPVTSPEAMKLQWSHSVLFERDYLNEWQAQEHASTLAAELGSSALLRVDTISLSMRRRHNPCKVRFSDDITVLIGEDNGMDLRTTMITHHALKDFADKPWKLPFP